MSIWKFILIKSDNTEIEVETPNGWEDIEVSIDRDPDWHGVFFSYSFSRLEFYGTGATIIKDEYENEGVNGQMQLRILFQCSTDWNFDVFYEGKLSFDDYSDSCGDECLVRVGLEDSNDIMLMRNNYEQPVNLNSNVAFDQITELTNYDKLNTELLVPNRGIPQRLFGFSDGSSFNTDSEVPIRLINSLGTWVVIRTNYNNNSIDEIRESDLVGVSQYAVSPPQALQPKGISPILTVKDQPTCYNELMSFDIRLKGVLKEQTTLQRLVSVYAVVNQGQFFNGINDTNVLAKQTIVYEQLVNGGAQSTIPFDATFTGQVLLTPNNTGTQPYYNDKIVVFLAAFETEGTASNPPAWIIEVDWDSASYVDIRTVSQCEPTESEVYFINEAASRTVEAITNDKIRFYSTFFGRIDSQPYSLPDQTCAGLFAISNGLNIRRRLLADGTQPGCFVTLKKLFDDLKAIWNIGLTIEPDKFRDGFNCLRFEDWRYFYQEQVGIIFKDAIKIDRDVDPSRLFNKLSIGYNKWTGEQFSGLDEIMTKRTYRINVNAVNKELIALSDLITAPYTIEITRRLDNNTQDWQYDNDIFAFCLKSSGNPAEYSVETFADVAYGIEHINDADTCYNGRVTPERNAMRWFNTVMQGLRRITTDSKLIFTSGEANYIARFGLSECNIEAQPIAENESISIVSFDDPNNAKPITFPELIKFDHPLNYNLFKRIKDEPTLKFKSIEVRCNGASTYGWIKNITYRPEEGMATITAIPKNNSVLPEIPGPEPCQASIVEGSVTMVDYDFEAGTAVIDFTEGNAGATLWSYIITQGETPGAGIGFSGTTTEHPFTVGDLTPGTWSVFIAPYCSPDQVGINYGVGTFDLEAPPFSIELTATLTNFGSNNHLVLTAHSIGDIPAPATFSFQWGQCVVNTSIPTEACRAYPGSPIPSPTNTLTFNAGETTVTQQSVTITAGSSYGYITKVVLYNLSGIISADISKATGQGWTLQFM